MTKHSPNTGEKKSRFKKGQLEAKIKAITNLWRGEARKEVKRQIEETKPSKQERQGDKDGDKVQPPHICFCYCHTGKRGGIMSCKHCRVKPKRK